ncbi:MAG: hypothetical protein FWD86_03410 [Firmicutes bacterium]|nr:hypothetical protein [Bacillota bacterium]
MIKLKKHSQFEQDLIAQVKADFKNRQADRLRFESQWRLNNNFYQGNQYSALNVLGEIENQGRDYYWQEREVYNHIASIVETRLARLSKSCPKLSVRAKSGSDSDTKIARAASKILSATLTKIDFDQIVSNATQVSEIMGSVFYKISWDKAGGKLLGVRNEKKVHEGEVRIDVCPPFEIFPDRINAQSIAECQSIIHAKAMPISQIEKTFNIIIDEEKIDSFVYDGVVLSGGLGFLSAVGTKCRGQIKDHAVVIERYTRPTQAHPNGTLEIVAGDNLLFFGDLPYKVGADNSFDLPFIKQDSHTLPDCFFGTSVIERVIPIQRAYNAVKNRKHEFMNRIAMGVLAVEDGSVDTDNLESEGLSPGKILVYRQGSTPPSFLNPGTIPSEFNKEEDRLIAEFIMVSGVSEIMRSSLAPNNVSSGVALQLLSTQDDTRLSTTADRVKAAVKGLAKAILRLYRQFGTNLRLSSVVGDDGNVEQVHWKGSVVANGDDVVFDTPTRAEDSISAKREMVFELLKSGLLNDGDGKLSEQIRQAALKEMGFGVWESFGEELEKGIKDKKEQKKEKISG